MTTQFPAFPPRSATLKAEMSRDLSKYKEALSKPGKGDVVTLWRDGTMIKEKANGQTVQMKQGEPI